jgi:hypothetical protein
MIWIVFVCLSELARKLEHDPGEIHAGSHLCLFMPRY